MHAALRYKWTCGQCGSRGKEWLHRDCLSEGLHANAWCLWRNWTRTQLKSGSGSDLRWRARLEDYDNQLKLSTRRG